MNILELFAHIGLKADQAPADRFLGAINGIKKDIIGAIAGTLSLAGAIKAVNAAMGDAMELKKFADATGASTDKMQQWRAVADQVSGSGAAVADSIKAIASNQDKIKLGQGNISGYQLLGIDPRQDPFKVLEQIREKTAKLAPAMRRNVIGMFGVSTDLISTLDLTNKQFDKMAGRAYVISPAMIDGLNRARGSMETVKNALNYFVAEMATKLGPTIEKVSGFILRFVKFIADGVVTMDKFIRSTFGWKSVITGIIAALAIFNAQLLLSPLGLFTAAILLLFLLLQDFAVFSSGKGRSLFGLLLGKDSKFKEFFDSIGGFATLKDVAGWILAIAAAWKIWNISLAASPLGQIAIAIGLIVTALTWLEANKDKIAAVLNNISESVIGKDMLKAVKQDQDLSNAVKEGRISKEQAEKLKSQSAAGKLSYMDAIIPTTQGNLDKRVTNIQNNYITGNYDAEGLTQRLSDEFSKRYRNVQNNMASTKREKN